MKIPYHNSSKTQASRPQRGPHLNSTQKTFVYSFIGGLFSICYAKQALPTKLRPQPLPWGNLYCMFTLLVYLTPCTVGGRPSKEQDECGISLWYLQFTLKTRHGSHRKGSVLHHKTTPDLPAPECKVRKHTCKEVKPGGSHIQGHPGPHETLSQACTHTRWMWQMTIPVT